MKKLKYIPIALLGLLSSCKTGDDVNNPDKENEEELITTVSLTLTDTSDVNNSVYATFQDIDGEGGNEPSVFDTIRLQQGIVYSGTIEFLNESNENEVEDITLEIEEEADEHLLCYDSQAHVDITRTDSDGLYEIGLETLWSTHNMTGEGTVTISLKHQPNGTKDGTCEVGESDVELAFVTVVEND